ncbi:hypothetical protein CCMA1212_007759 [Trichoderma ghanense]|uniref:Uncharacterized protein n=1 Tax=Trichoderma ghanense TaxID=65468 RepID=A0ABY2GZX1_9HYPO
MSVSNVSPLLTSYDNAMQSQADTRRNRVSRPSRRPSNALLRQQTSGASSRMTATPNDPPAPRIPSELVLNWIAQRASGGAAVVGNSAANGAHQTNTAAGEGATVAGNRAWGNRTRQRNRGCIVM